VAAGCFGLAAWAVLSLIASMVVVARRRSTSARALLAAAPA
jgi:putative membrane protein